MTQHADKPEGGPAWPYNLGVDERLFAIIAIGLGHDYYAIDLGLRADLEAEIQGERGDLDDIASANAKDLDDANECAASWRDRLAHLRKNLYEALEREDQDEPNEFDTTPEPDADDDVLGLVRDAIGTDELTRYRAAMGVDDVERLAGAFDDADEALGCASALETLAKGIGATGDAETVVSAALRGFSQESEATGQPDEENATARATARTVADRVIEYLRERPDDPTKTPAPPAKTPRNFGDII